VTAAEEQRIQERSDPEAAIAVVAIGRVISADMEHHAVAGAIALPVVAMIVAPVAIPPPGIIASIVPPRFVAAAIVVVPAVAVAPVAVDVRAVAVAIGVRAIALLAAIRLAIVPPLDLRHPPLAAPLALVRALLSPAIDALSLLRCALLGTL